MSNPTDAEILALARRHLDVGLCFDSTARITRATDAELITFARAALAAQQPADLDAYKRAAPLCNKHQPDGGTRSVCLVCACQKLSAALSRISYLCVEPNEMECGPYDVHCDEGAVVEQVEALVTKIAAAPAVQPNTWANVLLLVNEYAGHVVDASLHQAESRADIARSAALKTLGKLHQAFEARRDPSAQPSILSALDYSASRGIAVTKEWCRGWDDCRALVASAAPSAQPVAVFHAHPEDWQYSITLLPGVPMLRNGTLLAAAPSAPPQWKPIETAPTGRIHSPPLHAIVASVLDSGEFYVEEAWWDNERLEWWPANVDYGDAHGSAVHPTHWMPLPDAPGGITGGTEGGAQADGAQGSER